MRNRTNVLVRRILFGVLGVILLLGAVVAYKTYQYQNPYQLQTVYDHGVAFQEFAPVDQLKSDQQQLFVTLPKGNSEVIEWIANNNGCLVFSSSGNWWSHRPKSQINVETGSTFYPGDEIFISCLQDGSELSFYRHIPRPVATEMPTPTVDPTANP